MGRPQDFLVTLNKFFDIVVELLFFEKRLALPGEGRGGFALPGTTREILLGDSILNLVRSPLYPYLPHCSRPKKQK